jgi:hypothetical protein
MRKEAFRVRDTTRQKLARRKRRILKRLASRKPIADDKPVLSASNIHYEFAGRAVPLGAAGLV